MAEVVAAHLLPGGIAEQALVHHVGGEGVDPHRGQHLVGVPGHGRGVGRLLDEVEDPAVGVDDQDAQLARGGPGHREAGDGQVGLAVAVERDHLGIIHLVDVVAGQDQGVARGGLLDRVDVLVDRVGGPLVPVVGDPLLGRDHLDVLVQLAGEELPALVDVPVQAHRLVLGEDQDLAEVGVDAIREGEVDDPVDPAERDGRLGPVAGQGLQPGCLGPRPGRWPTRRDAPRHLRFCPDRPAPAGSDGRRESLRSLRYTNIRPPTQTPRPAPLQIFPGICYGLPRRPLRPIRENEWPDPEPTAPSRRARRDRSDFARLSPFVTSPSPSPGSPRADDKLKELQAEAVARKGEKLARAYHFGSQGAGDVVLEPHQPLEPADPGLHLRPEGRPRRRHRGQQRSIATPRQGQGPLRLPARADRQPRGRVRRPERPLPGPEGRRGQGGEAPLHRLVRRHGLGHHPGRRDREDGQGL